MAKCDKIRIIMVEYSKNLGGNYMGIYCKILSILLHACKFF